MRRGGPPPPGGHATRNQMHPLLNQILLLSFSGGKHAQISLVNTSFIWMHGHLPAMACICPRSNCNFLTDLKWHGGAASACTAAQPPEDSRPAQRQLLRSHRTAASAVLSAYVAGHLRRLQEACSSGLSAPKAFLSLIQSPGADAGYGRRAQHRRDIEHTAGRRVSNFLRKNQTLCIQFMHHQHFNSFIWIDLILIESLFNC